MDPESQASNSPSNTASAAEGSGEPPIPGRVLFVRNMPLDTTDQELVAVGSAYGQVVNTLIMNGKGNGFIEMDTVQAANALLAQTTLQIRGRTIIFQPSQHTQLKRSDGQQTGSNTGSGSSGHSYGGDANNEAKPVLRVEIHNVLYVVTLDVLHTIFSKFGQVLRIITFNKNNIFQALIQFADVNSARAAKTNLDGQSIYTGCCNLRIFFSKLEELTVKFNNDKSRDYTNPSLPSGENVMPYPGGNQRMGGPGAGGYGNNNYGNNAYGYGNNAGGQPGYGNFNNPYNNNIGGGVQGYGSNSMGRNVLLVSNLNEQHVTTDVLFMLIGVYADVHRVKILFNKKDTALVQVTDSQQAQTAIQNLNNQILFGKELHLSISKHQNVALPRPGSEGEAFDLTKEYINSPLHRFKVPGSKNFANICPPCDTLHVSNIPDNTQETDMIAEFSKHAPVVLFRFFPNNHKMGLVKFHSIDEAMQALVAMNNYKINGTTYLRVSFSKSSAN